MLTILSNIVALALVGALDSKALDVTCAMHEGDPVVLATTRTARAATEAALTAALVPFEVKPHDKASELSYVYNGRTVTHATDYATAARVHGPRLIGWAS